MPQISKIVYRSVSSLASFPMAQIQPTLHPQITGKSKANKQNQYRIECCHTQSYNKLLTFDVKNVPLERENQPQMMFF